MSSFSRFQARNKAGKVAEQKLNTSFIFKGYPSIGIVNKNQEIQAAVVNKQEKDMAYVFTQSQDELPIGTVWTAKNLKLLISQEITIIKDVNWHKYYAFLCNVQIGDEWGYFKGPGKSFLDILLEQKVVLDSAQKPMLVLSKNVLKFKDKIVIGDRAWIVQEYDEITTPGLVYYSLKPTTISKEMNNIPTVKAAENIIDDSHIIIKPLENITVQTEQGYFKTNNNNIKIKKHTETEVIFYLPFGVSNVKIEFLKNNCKETKCYKAVK